jgi:tryptophanyl-tRNA synthetase
VQERYRELRQDPGALDTVLKQGRERATTVAEATLGRVRDALGFLAFGA